MNITVHNKSEITAQGVPRNRNAKPVICLTTGEVYTSATDAAEANGVSIYSVSMNCLGKTKRSKGKRYCYLSKVTEHLDELTESIQMMAEKAKKYDELVARKETKSQTEMPKPEPTQTYTKAKPKPKSFGRKIIDMFAKRNVRTA